MTKKKYFVTFKMTKILSKPLKQPKYPKTSKMTKNTLKPLQ